jgi:hypothetical protein
MKPFRFMALVAFIATTCSHCVSANTLANVPFAFGPPTSPAPGDNHLQLDLNVFGSHGLTSTTLTGTMEIDLDFDTAGQVAYFKVNTASFTAQNFSLLAGALAVFPENVGGDPGAASGQIAVTGSAFDATGINMVINQGKGDEGPVLGIDFAANPIPFAGVGSGSLTQTSTGNPGEYSIVISFPVDGGSAPVLFGDLQLSGNILVTSVVTIPEPTAGLLWGAMTAVAAAVSRRRRR